MAVIDAKQKQAKTPLLHTRIIEYYLALIQSSLLA